MFEIVFYSFILLILIVWSIGLFLVFVSIVEQIFYTWNNSRVVFLPTELSLIKGRVAEWIKKYDLKTEEMTLLELGCGRAGFLRSMSKLSWKEKIGVEGQLVLSLKSKFLNFGKKIQIIHGDIFNYNIPSNSLVYCYLGIDNMNQLYNLGKLKGSLIISLDYAIEGVEAIESIKISDRKIQNHLHLYDFR
jgi:hypothetical protein